MHTQPTPHDPDPLETDRLTWAVLLANWTEFARSAAALPEEGQAGIVRASVTDIITLQAVWFSLQHLDELDVAQRAIGLDRAAVLVERHATQLRARFEGTPMPDGLASLLEDAQAALRANQNS